MIKRKTKEAIKILGVALLVIYMLGTIVSAATESSFKVEVSPEETTIKPGEEVTIKIKVTDINMGENGINTLEGTLEYDKELFEEVKSEDIESHENWSTTYNDENTDSNGKFLSVNLVEGTKEDTEILSVKLKAKETVEEITKTKVEIKDITSNNVVDLINVGTKTVEVTIGEEEVPNDNTNETNNTIEENITTNNIQSNNTGDNTQSGTKLPHTGSSTVTIVGLIAIISITIFLGIKNRLMKDIK